MKDAKEKQVTLESIAAQLERIEGQLNKRDKEQKDAKDWKDLQELGGLFVLGAGLVYLYMSGGFGAIISWLKGFFLLG